LLIEGLTLDSSEMTVTIENSSNNNGKSVFDRLQSGTTPAVSGYIPSQLNSHGQGHAGSSDNIRSGLFGTALPSGGGAGSRGGLLSRNMVFSTSNGNHNIEDDDEDEMEEEGDEEDDDDDEQVVRRVTLASGSRVGGRGRGSGGRGRGHGRGNSGRGGGGRVGGRGGAARRPRTNSRSEGDLDNELDQYMADR
jgi:hypothetical protein